LLHDVEIAMRDKVIVFSSTPFTDPSPQASPASVHRRNSSAAKTMSTSSSFTIFANVPDGEDVGIIEGLIAQQPLLMTVLDDDIYNLDISLQPLGNADRDTIVVSFQNPEHVTLFRTTLEPLLRETHYTIGDTRSPSPGKNVRNLHFGQGGVPIEDITARPIDTSTGGGKGIAAQGGATPLYGTDLAPEASTLFSGTEIEGAPGDKRSSLERVLFIGTQFSILYTFMHSPA